MPWLAAPTPHHRCGGPLARCGVWRHGIGRCISAQRGPTKAKALLSQGLHFLSGWYHYLSVGVVGSRYRGPTAPAYFTRVLATWLQGPMPLVPMPATRKYATCPLGSPVTFAVERVLTATSCQARSSLGSPAVHWMW